MTSPAQAVLWQFWWRNRWGFVLGAAYLLAAGTIIRLLPPELRAMSFQGIDRPLIAEWLGFPCVFLLMHVLAVFTTSEGGLKDSGFSSHTFILPVKTRTLVAVPMVAGCLTMTAVWMATALLVLRPAGANAPLIWPGAAAALMLALLQVVSWVPLAQSWLRIALVIPAVAVGLAAIPLNIAFGDQAEALRTVLLLLPIPAAYLVAIHVVAMSRRGDAYDWRAWQRLVERLAAWRKPAEHPFSSADRAQLWFEWSGHGWVLPVTLGSIVLFTTPLLVLTNQTEVAAGWRFLGILVVMPMVFAVVIGGQFGRQDVWSDCPMSPFLAARPISTIRLIIAKLCICLGATLAGSLLTLLGVLMLLLRPGFAAQIVQVAQTVGVWKSIAIVATATVSLIAITWLQMASNMWISLAGRKWFESAFAFTFAAVVGIGTLAGVWIYFHAELHGYVQAAVPWVVRLLLATKLVIATVVLTGLLRTRLVGPVSAAAMVGVWSLIAGGLWLTAWSLAPAGSVPLATVAAGIALAVPFSRLAGAPLALHWNRHR